MKNLPKNSGFTSGSVRSEYMELRKTSSAIVREVYSLCKRRAEKFISRANERTGSKTKGFTLVELLIAISIFTIVMTLSMGSIVGIFDSNRKVRSLKTVMNNLNLAVESMSKEMRFGKNYHCGAGTVTIPQNCASGDTLMSFLATDGSQITYRLNGATIEKQVGNGGYVAVTAPELIIDNLTFYTLGAGTDNALQPKVIIRIKSHAGTGKSRSDFTLETMVSQRSLDI